MDIEQRVKNLVANIAAEDITKITRETNLMLDLGYDSIKFVELIVKLESEFGIIMDDTDLDIDKITVYNKLLDIISEKIANNFTE